MFVISKKSGVARLCTVVQLLRDINVSKESKKINGDAAPYPTNQVKPQVKSYLGSSDPLPHFIAHKWVFHTNSAKFTILPLPLSPLSGTSQTSEGYRFNKTSISFEICQPLSFYRGTNLYFKIKKWRNLSKVIDFIICSLVC